MSNEQTLPVSVPREMTRGETVAWSRSLSSYPASDGWTLTTYFRGAGKGVDVVAEVSGSSYVSTMTAEQSGTMAIGRYDWQAWVVLDDAKYMVDSGAVNVLPGFVDVDTDTTVDGRSEAEASLAEVRLALGKAAAKNAAEYSIAARMKREHSIPDLTALEANLVARVNAERLRNKTKAGGPLFQTVHTRFRG